MRKGHSLLGLQVVSQSEGTSLGKVIDLVFDHDANACIGLMLREKSLLRHAQVVAWQDIETIGKDVVMVREASTVVDPIKLPAFRAVMEQDTHLSGTQIISEDGHILGSFADVYLDERTGRVVGYEVSGGFVSDTMSGKRYVPADRTHDVRVGNDVLIASRGLSEEFARQEREEPGGLKPVLASTGEKVSDAYASAKEKVSQTYNNLAEASVEKQKEFVIGKTAGRDVFLPAPSMAATDVIVEDTAPILADEATPQLAKQAAEEEANDLRPEHGPLLVATGQTITSEHAHTAEQAGILGQLLIAAGAGATRPALDSGRENLALATSDTNETSTSLVGKTAKREVLLPNGSTLVASGMTVTEHVVALARQYDKEDELAASVHATSPTTSGSDTAQSIGTTATTVFETIKHKVAELTGTAQEIKAQRDEAALQKKINHAIGRPVTRIILDRDDNIILNTGDIITHRAIEQSKAADMLDILLDSVYEGMPPITPDMMSVPESGEAALPEQVKPVTGPIVTRDPNSEKENAPSTQQEEQLQRS